MKIQTFLALLVILVFTPVNNLKIILDLHQLMLLPKLINLQLGELLKQMEKCF